MKAKLVFILIFSLLTTCVYSKINTEEDPIEVSLTLYMVNKQKIGNNSPKSQELSVSILDRTLYFEGVGEDIILCLYDENDVLVFTAAISSMTRELELPETLFGTYELYLETNDYYYLGCIDL